MKREPINNEDPVVAEVRAIRAKLWKQGGGTAAGYLALMREQANTRPDSKNRSKPRTRRQ